MLLRDYLRGVGITVPAFAARIGEAVSVVEGWVYQQKQPTLPNAILIEAATGGQVLPRDLVLPGKLKELPPAAVSTEDA